MPSGKQVNDFLKDFSKIALPWRTWIGLLALGQMMLVALLICRNTANGIDLLRISVTGLGGIGLWLAGKSGWEHSANAKAAATAKEPAASVLAQGATG